jgi:hypothetical protein
MGQGVDTDSGPPRLRAIVNGVSKYELDWGNETSVVGPSWHVATGPAEYVTATEWATIATAAAQGAQAMRDAILATAAGPAWLRAEAKAVAGPGVIALRQQTAQRYAPWAGLALGGPWTG